MNKKVIIIFSVIFITLIFVIYNLNKNKTIKKVNPQSLLSRTNNITTPINNITTPINNITTPINNITTPINNITTPINNITPINNMKTIIDNNITTPINNNITSRIANNTTTTNIKLNEEVLPFVSGTGFPVFGRFKIVYDN
jgi:hypothetical protein